jgi:hypothetical protein
MKQAIDICKAKTTMTAGGDSIGFNNALLTPNPYGLRRNAQKSGRLAGREKELGHNDVLIS